MPASGSYLTKQLTLFPCTKVHFHLLKVAIETFIDIEKRTRCIFLSFKGK
ncbi:MAG: hypothetical protein K0R82_273 [Flavipsychrobacter sp.]|jgi:hypothetical protein|nr:hypothetical protein [Flavipsychrobacter sp.]